MLAIIIVVVLYYSIFLLTDRMLLLLSFLWQLVHGEREREKKSPLKSVEGRKIVSGEREREHSDVSKY